MTRTGIEDGAVTTTTTTFGQELGLALPQRGRKPREQGLTMVMDQGWPVTFVEGMLEAFGDHLDIVKLWDPHLYQPTETVLAKVELYRRHNIIVQPGGIWLEVAGRQGKTRELLHRLRDFGFNAIEVSSTTSTRSGMEHEAETIPLARELGYVVFGEVGRKFPDGDETRLTEDTVDINVTLREFREQLSAGAWKVYWEGHLLRKVMGDDPDSIKQRASTGTLQILQVAKEIGPENIIFEASGLRPIANRQWLQFWLVRLFGPEVNIGNARIEEMANLEAIRSGNHPIFGFDNSGNYAWLRAYEEGNETDWWKS
jgi:phosphosulfolactate synthase